MQVRYEKDNKERIPFEHYLEEFAAIDPSKATCADTNRNICPLR